VPPRVPGWRSRATDGDGDGRSRPIRVIASAQPSREGLSMWGAPSSGKTTFGAALGAALEKHPQERWRLRGVDVQSGEELGTMMNALVHAGEFPGDTQQPAEYNWELVNPDPTAGRRGAFGLPRRDRTERIALHLRDGPGRFQNPENWLDTPRARELVETMVSCAGFIFLYDPVFERARGDSYQHTSALLARIDQRVGGGPGGYLPQYLAVCVAKFDDDRVYRSARAANLVDYNHATDGSPYVPDEIAEEFFTRMCRVSPNPAATELPQKLNRYFHPDRIRFFVTSAIGFYVNPGTGRFDPGDYRNIIAEPGEKPKIRAAIRPINVMEPVLWLAGKLKRSQS
jgi:hypothetical protein